jgi:hypothetical protein
MALPTNIPKRGLSLAEAAEYCGVSDKTLQRHGPEPSKIGERVVYDRRVLDRWMDNLADLPSSGLNPIENPENLLLKAIDARKTALRHTPAKSQRKGAVVLAAPRPQADPPPRQSGRADGGDGEAQ